MSEATTSPEGQAVPPKAGAPAPKASVEPVFPVLGADTAQSNARGVDGLGFVMDIPVELTVEIGRRKMKIGDILRLGPGSVLELTKAAGESLDIYANNRLVARGEAVAIGERYGVRLHEVVVTADAGKVGEGTQS